MMSYAFTRGLLLLCLTVGHQQGVSGKKYTLSGGVNAGPLQAMGSLSIGVSDGGVTVTTAASGSATVADTTFTAGGSASGALTTNGITDTVSFSGGLTSGFLDTLGKDVPALIPLIDTVNHVSGEFNSPTVQDLVAISKDIMDCVEVDGGTDDVQCVLTAAEDILGSLCNSTGALLGTDFTNCPEVMEQVRLCQKSFHTLMVLQMRACGVQLHNAVQKVNTNVTMMTLNQNARTCAGCSGLLLPTQS